MKIQDLIGKLKKTKDDLENQFWTGKGGDILSAPQRTVTNIKNTINSQSPVGHLRNIANTPTPKVLQQAVKPLKPLADFGEKAGNFLQPLADKTTMRTIAPALESLAIAGMNDRERVAYKPTTIKPTLNEQYKDIASGTANTALTALSAYKPIPVLKNLAGLTLMDAALPGKDGWLPSEIGRDIGLSLQGKGTGFSGSKRVAGGVLGRIPENLPRATMYGLISNPAGDKTAELLKASRVGKSAITGAFNVGEDYVTYALGMTDKPDAKSNIMGFLTPALVDRITGAELSDSMGLGKSPLSKLADEDGFINFTPKGMYPRGTHIEYFNRMIKGILDKDIPEGMRKDLEIPEIRDMVNAQMDWLVKQSGAINFGAKIGGDRIPVKQLERVQIESLTPKTDLLKEAGELRKAGELELYNRKMESLRASEERGIYGEDLVKDINKLKAMFKAKDVQEGDIETLRKKNPKFVESVIERVRQAIGDDSLPDEDVLDRALLVPTKAELKVKKVPELAQARELEQRAKKVKDLVYNSELDPTVREKLIKENQKALEFEAKQEYKNWEKDYLESRKYFIKKEGLLTPKQLENKRLKEISQAVRKATSPAYINPEGMKDITNIQKGFADIDRVFKSVFKDPQAYKQAKEEFLVPLDNSKLALKRSLENWSSKLENEVVNKYDVKPNSKEAGLLQQYGEKEITLRELVDEIGKDRAKDIVLADRWFRDKYSQGLKDYNDLMRKIYPNNPEKIVPERKDYYRHFTDFGDGLTGLKNIFETPANISPELVAVSRNTKPKSMWQSFAQKRTGDKTKLDAVGGFINYISKLEYSKNIDPHIAKLRALQEDLEINTAETKNLNNFINFIDKYAGDLAGKTNEIDAIFQEWVPGGRKGMRLLNWLNNRVKANVIVGNISSSLAQIFNVPQGFADAGIDNSARGVLRTLKGVMNEDIYKDADFLETRFAKDPFSKFDESLLSKTKEFLSWFTTIGDEIGTRAIWNAEYERALKEGIDNPAKFASDKARSMVAGRGIGEVPLAQKSKVTQLIMPFQLEVANLWWVFKDWAGEGRLPLAKKLLEYSIYSYILNAGVKKIRGSDVSFDPINAFSEATQAYMDEEDKKTGALRFGGRLGGEVLSNLPLGQTVASLYPEYGVKAGESQLPTRSQFFGEGDPTRYGSGLLAVKGLQDPLFKVLPPFGGQQIKRTLEGVDAYAQGYSETGSGKIRFPIKQDARNLAQSAVFGQYAVPEAQEYFEAGRTPLGEKQSEEFKMQGGEPFYSAIMAKRDKAKENDKIKLKFKQAVDKEGTVPLISDDLDKIAYAYDLESFITSPPSGELEYRKYQVELLSDARSLYKNENIPEEYKQGLLAKHNINPEELELDILANSPVIDRAIWVRDRLETMEDSEKQAFLSSLYNEKTLSGSRIFTEGVAKELGLEDLYDSVRASSKPRKLKIAQPSKIKFKSSQVQLPQIKIQSQSIKPTVSKAPAFTQNPTGSSKLNVRDLYKAFDTRR